MLPSMYYAIICFPKQSNTPEWWHLHFWTSKVENQERNITQFLPEGAAYSQFKIWTLYNDGQLLCLPYRQILTYVTEMMTLRELTIEVCIWWLVRWPFKVNLHKIDWEIAQIEKHLLPSTGNCNLKSLTLQLLQKQQYEESQFLPYGRPKPQLLFK